jgi:hypothetical protein
MRGVTSTYVDLPDSLGASGTRKPSPDLVDEAPTVEAVCVSGEFALFAAVDNLEDLLLPNELSDDCKVVETPEMLDC